MNAMLSRNDRLANERTVLAKAEHDIVEGEQRITEQTIQILALKAEGRATEQAELLLTTLWDTLALWYAHRVEILATIQRLEAEATSG